MACQNAAKIPTFGTSGFFKLPLQSEYKFMWKWCQCVGELLRLDPRSLYFSFMKKCVKETSVRLWPGADKHTAVRLLPKAIHVITFGNKRVYVAGDTENIPEMKNLEKIDIAFLPMNLPYTMTPEMVAGAAKMFKPNILYPYHYGKTDVSKIVNLLKEEKEIEIRIRKMK